MLDNFFPHPDHEEGLRVGDWAAANNVVELAHAQSNSSWLNRIEAQFTALRYFALDGTDYASPEEQGSMIRRYILWRNSTPPTNGYGKWPTGQTLPDAALDDGREDHLVNDGGHPRRRDQRQKRARSWRATAEITYRWSELRWRKWLRVPG